MRTRAGRARTRVTRGGLFTKLPADLQLECLARVPYADLCGGVIATCKTWKNIVLSKAYRETRTAAGWTEYAVFMSLYGNDKTECFLVTGSGAHRAAPRPAVNNSWTLKLWDEVYVVSDESYSYTPGFKHEDGMHVFDPRLNEWCKLTELVHVADGHVSEGATAVASDSAGKLFVVGGCGAHSGSDSERRVHAYDPATDEWSRLPDQPRPAEWAGDVELDGRLYFYGTYEDPASMAIFNPVSHTWETGPCLPHVPDAHELHAHITGFAREGCLVVMARFCLGSTDESIKYAAFVYDPSVGAWSEAPFPPAPVRAYRCTHIDGTLFAFGSEGADVRISDQDNPVFSPPENVRVVMLRPGSTTWVDLPMPDEMKCYGTRTAAVEVG